VSAATDLAMALDRAPFARSLGVEPDLWQERLLCSGSARILLNWHRFRSAKLENSASVH
jgi:hypothetical protein